MKILFICTGNICRSPSAEGVLRKMCADAKLNWQIDSAGISSWHGGEPPDLRAQRAAAARQYNIGTITARPVSPADFSQFDRIYGMTKEHCEQLQAMAPADAGADILLFLDSCGMPEDVPDPYFGGDTGFEHMMDLLEQGCAAIVRNAPGG